MYSETQSAQNAPLRYVQGCCLVLGLLQLAALIAAETGALYSPLSYGGHVCLLLTSLAAALLIRQAKLVLEVNREGLALRFFPYKWRRRYIGWQEIRQISLISRQQLPIGAFFGIPGRDFTHLYWLSNAKHAIVQITLVNGSHLYVSSTQPAALLQFLRHGIHAGLIRP